MASISPVFPKSLKRFQRIYVEIGNVCNLQCEFCPPVKRPKKLMSPEEFENICEQIKPYTNEITLHLMGEPTAHPRFSEFVSIAERFDFDINLTTNGTLLVEKNAMAMVQKAIKQINFSVHSFESNFPGKPIEPYLEKICNFIQNAEKTRPDLYFNFRMWNFLEENTVSDPSLFESNKKIIDYVQARFGLMDPLAKIDLRIKKVIKVKPRFGLHFDSRFHWPDLSQPFQGNTGTCRALQQHIGIHADGTIVPCCLDKEKTIDIGNIFRKKFSQILQEERLRNMQKGFRENRLIESLCQHCDYANRFRKKDILETPEAKQA